jgi:hypothetical protein
MTIDISKLSKPFAANEIEWRAQRSGFSGNGDPWCMVLAYVTNRAVMNRLDEVFGPLNWQNDFKIVSNGFLCGIGAFDGEKWVWKWDGAQETDIEATKGGLSGAMKRAAVQWNIGRYLYDLESTFAECTMTKPAYKDKHLWHQARSGDKTFYWKTPTLPDWALPK